MSAGQLQIEIAKKDNKIKDLNETIKTLTSDYETLKSDFSELKQSHERQIKIAVDEFIDCDKKRIEQTKKNEKLAGELFDLKQKKLIKLSIWIGGLRK
jgi:archaellum component FlaC